MSRVLMGPGSMIHLHRRDRGDTAFGRSFPGAPDVATIVAVGPFDDLEHAQHLAAMFIAVQRTCLTELVLLGTGVGRSLVVRRAAERALQTRLVLVEEPVGQRRSQLLATADLVIPGPGTMADSLVEVMAASRAVVAPANAVTAELVMPHSAGLLYAPGDVSAMIAAVARLLAHPELRHQMGSRASQVAQRHRMHPLSGQWPEDEKKYA
jgi:glycosyltransferase involved in cell wall biosynthesis